MSLARLDIAGIRNIRQATLELSPEINLIYGRNGSGKTSILESVYILGAARSYRNISVEPLISMDQDECLVRGVINSGNTQHTIAVLRKRGGEREIRVDGDGVKRATDLANLFPTLVVGPEAVNVLLGPPAIRRRFLNWGLFHVEPSFTQIWEDANRCLRQRNELLRQNASVNELGTWTRELVRHSEQMDKLRAVYAQNYEKIFLERCEQLTELQGISCRYYRGWSHDSPLQEIYEKDEETDRKRGFTQRGFQRADVRIRVAGEDTVSACSRGELKVISWTMIISQGAMLGDATANNLVYLVDDLGSELDRQHHERFCTYLMSTGKQILATGIERERLVDSWGGKDIKLFHVERGSVEQEERMNDGQ
ncbi:MAG: DNA replication/repair protein RecF [Gammaproteobacteria bacterium]|nr:DNA replication/repair protein RecF [Gammaproteobacteria bacterium]